MKQVDGRAMVPILSIRSTLSSGVVVATAMVLMQEFSASTAAVGAVAATSVSVYVLQYSNVISVI